MMEVAKVTSKGQITIPISIRRKLEINEGDKVLFIYKHDGVLMVNPSTYQAGADSDIIEIAASEIAVEAVAATKENNAAKAPPEASEPAVAAVEQSVDHTSAEEASVKEDSIPEETQRPVPPPVPEPEKQEPSVGGLNLGSLLDDIRSIGSNI